MTLYYYSYYNSEFIIFLIDIKEELKTKLR